MARTLCLNESKTCHTHSRWVLSYCQYQSWSSLAYIYIYTSMYIYQVRGRSRGKKRVLKKEKTHLDLIEVRRSHYAVKLLVVPRLLDKVCPPSYFYSLSRPRPGENETQTFRRMWGKLYLARGISEKKVLSRQWRWDGHWHLFWT